MPQRLRFSQCFPRRAFSESGRKKSHLLSGYRSFWQAWKEGGTRQSRSIRNVYLPYVGTSPAICGNIPFLKKALPAADFSPFFIAVSICMYL